MIIKIDTREQELYKKCESTILSVQKFSGIQLVSEPLPLGDIIINDGTNDSIIIERKTLTDLAASIKDGRYEEQSYRLNGLQLHNHNIIYLIEGDMFRFNTFKERIDKQTLYSAMFSINYFKGFSVMRSNNIDETAMICCNMVYKLVSGLKAGKFGHYNKPHDMHIEEQNNTSEEATDKATDKDYCSVIKKVKKDNITPDNIGEIMLCQIPGISSKTAIAILTHFKTLPNLIKQLQEDNNCLNSITISDDNGKCRKISKTVISNLIKFLIA
jgi:ERCC4-type nuclease